MESSKSKTDVGLDDYDRGLIQTAVIELYEAKVVGGVRKWENPRNGHTGLVTYLGPKNRADEELQEFKFHIKAKKSDTKVVMLRKVDNRWEIVP